MVNCVYLKLPLPWDCYYILPHFQRFSCVMATWDSSYIERTFLTLCLLGNQENSIIYQKQYNHFPFLLCENCGAL